MNSEDKGIPENVFIRLWELVNTPNSLPKYELMFIPETKVTYYDVDGRMYFSVDGF